jgi:hypothetical protein
MVVLAPQVTPARDEPRPLPVVVTGPVLLLSALLLGVLGWILPTAGGSLVIPTLIVFAIGCAIGGTFWFVSGAWAPLVGLAAITAVASVWTFAFSLPTAMALDSSATSQAQAALAQLGSSPRGQSGVPLHPCETEGVGSIGPIKAPYTRCAVSTPGGHSVRFTEVGHEGGISYTDVGAADFPDECTRHLTGEWWMFVVESKDAPGGCPIGYHFQGGP